MYQVKRIPRYLFAIISLIPIYIAYRYHNIPAFMLLLIFGGIVFTRLFIKKSPENALIDMSPLWIGFFYISLMLSYFIMLRLLGPEWVVFLCTVIWGADAMAYYTGKAVGKRKLFKSVSPNKTIEGLYGSITGALLISILIKIVFNIEISLPKIIFVGILVGLIGVIGDLVESMFKRDAGVKDSSNLIPGHGGILDKIDGMLFTAPVLYYFLKFWG